MQGSFEKENEFSDISGGQLFFPIVIALDCESIVPMVYSVHHCKGKLQERKEGRSHAWTICVMFQRFLAKLKLSL